MLLGGEIEGEENCEHDDIGGSKEVGVEDSNGTTAQVLVFDRQGAVIICCWMIGSSGFYTFLALLKYKYNVQCVCVHNLRIEVYYVYCCKA